MSDDIITSDEFIRGGHLDVWAIQTLAYVQTTLLIANGHEGKVPPEDIHAEAAKGVTAIWEALDEKEPVEADSTQRAVNFISTVVMTASNALMMELAKRGKKKK